MNSRLSIEERIQIVLLYGKFVNYSEIKRQRHFTTEVPHIRTIRNLVTKFKETGSVQDLARSGRSRFRPELLPLGIPEEYRIQGQASYTH